MHRSAKEKKLSRTESSGKCGKEKGENKNKMKETSVWELRSTMKKRTLGHNSGKFKKSGCVKVGM